MTKVAIITVNYNGKDDTLELLQSLRQLKIDNGQLKIVVVDNGSSDDSVLAINAKYPDIDILQNGDNEGFSGGYNRGMIYGLLWGADYLLIINNDALIKDPNLIGSLLDTFQKNENIGIVCPKIYFAPGFEFHKEKYSQKDRGKVIWYAGGQFDWKNIHSTHYGMDEVDKGQFSKKEETKLVTGCCMMIKKELLEKVKKPESGFGFFDDNLFLYFEDNDFLQRAKKVGFKAYYDGSVAIYHKASQSAGIGSEITDFFHTRNRLVMGFRYSSLRTKLALIRESIKFLVIGRNAQRLGVLDFFLGKRGSSARFINESKKAQYQLKLSICIVNYNTANLTLKLLQSIFKKESGYDPDSMEVVVLDNGNVDPSFDHIKEYKIKYLKNEENEGFSKGYNKTISYAKGQYILMLNSDIEVLKNSLTIMIKSAQNYKDEAILGGKLVFPDRSDQDSAFNLPTITGAFREYFLGQKGTYFMYMPNSLEPTKVEGLVMACFLIPEKILNKVGLLDEETFIFFEDIEYCSRAKKYNVPLYYIPQAKFIHHHGASTKKIGQDKAFELLQKSAKHYHGLLYYTLLTFVLRLGQKIGKVKTPVSRWTKE